MLGVPVATTAVLLLAAAPAWARPRDDGEVIGEPIGALETLLLYVVAPAALFLVITLLVLAPSMSRSPRYRPGLGWWAAPIWFNGPAQEDLDAVVRAAVPTTDGGGASARW